MILTLLILLALWLYLSGRRTLRRWQLEQCARSGHLWLDTPWGFRCRRCHRLTRRDRRSS